MCVTDASADAPARSRPAEPAAKPTRRPAVRADPPGLREDDLP